MAWDADQYLKFERERTQPSRDLIARVPLAAPHRIVDLGCGPGNSTKRVAQRWPEAQVTGVDSSPAMLEQARRDYPEMRWIEADIAGFSASGAHDLIFSNAALQWVPDHATVFPALFEALPPGGVLAVQMPRNFAAPNHALLREIAAEPRWAARMPEEARLLPVGDPGFYHDLLAPRAARLDIFEIEYLHVLDGPEGIVEWMKGSGLRPFLQRLDASEHDDFLASYLDRMKQAYPRRASGQVLFPFKRIFLVASR
ncbi:MAG: trans-aconitate 2-methyltransferase [Byssovorax sp.]